MERNNNPLVRVGVHLLLLLWLVFSVTPFLWTLLNSFKLPRDAIARVPRILFEPTGQNYARLWLNTTPEAFAPIGIGLFVLACLLALLGFFADRLPVPRALVYFTIVAVFLGALLLVPRLVNMAEFYRYFLNTLIVTVSTVTISISIGCLAGYALARYVGLTGVVILVVALAFRALPDMAFVLPYYYLGQMSGLYDTLFLLTVTLVATNQPFTIWMLRSFFMDIPREIEEAAMIDGAGRLKAFTHVIIPIMWPGIITTALFSLLLAYNSFLLPRILTQSNWTLSVAISQYTGGEDVRHLGVAAAGSVSITLPIVLVILFFQKYFVKGLAAGAVKG